MQSFDLRMYEEGYCNCLHISLQIEVVFDVSTVKFYRIIFSDADRLITKSLREEDGRMFICNRDGSGT